MGIGVNSCAPANQAGYGGASCSADSSQSEFVNLLSQEQQSSSGAGQPVCTDPTAPTPREKAAQQSLPENERHLPPRFIVQGGGTVGHQSGGIPNNPHLSENAKKSAESKSQAPAKDTGGRDWEFCMPYVTKGCGISSTASVVASEVKGLAKDAVKGSRVITEGISRGTTAAGNWVSDQANDLASRLDESGYHRLASATRGGGVLAATATKTVGEVAGQVAALGPNMVLGLDSAGTNIGVGAARVSLAKNSEERWRGIAQISGGVGEGALVTVGALSLGEGAMRPRAAGPLGGGGGASPPPSGGAASQPPSGGGPLFPNLSEAEVESAVSSSKSGTAAKLPGQNPKTGEGLVDQVTKADATKPIAHHDNMKFKGIKDAPGGKVEVRRHSANPNAPEGSYSKTNPTTQVNTTKPKTYMLPDGTFKPLEAMTDAEKAAAHFR